MLLLIVVRNQMMNSIRSEVDRGRKLLRLSAVLNRTGLSRATTYALMNAGEFPRPVRLSSRAVAWFEDSIDNWIESRPVAGKRDKR
jgi:prophage regulatory protein